MPYIIPIEEKEFYERKTKDFKSLITKLENGYWEIPGTPDKYGYKRFTIKKSISISAHRASYQIFKGLEGMLELNVCHTCDNPWGVNPEHLYLGTHKQNRDDSFKRERNPYCLKFEQIKQIKEQYETKIYTQKEIGDKFGINQC